MGKTLYPIEYKESYKPDLHFLKIRSLLHSSLRKLQASKCTESWLVLTTTVETVSFFFFFKGLVKACCRGRFWSLATLKAKKTQGLTISPRVMRTKFVFMYIYTFKC